MSNPQKTTKCLSCHITCTKYFLKKTGIEHLPNTFSHKVLCSHLTVILREIQLPAKGGKGEKERERVKNPKAFQGSLQTTRGYFEGDQQIAITA